MALFTSATTEPLNLLSATALAVVTAIPSMLIGVIVGTACGPKAAIAVTQVVMFLLAFGGGLFLPPVVFPDWLNTASMFLPVRQAREIVIAAALGDTIPGWAILGILARGDLAVTPRRGSSVPLSRRPGLLIRRRLSCQPSGGGPCASGRRAVTGPAQKRRAGAGPVARTGPGVAGRISTSSSTPPAMAYRRRSGRTRAARSFR